MKSIKLEVEGMKCEGCANRIKNSLEMLDFVRSVTVSQKEKMVEVVLNDELGSEQVKNAITDLGFSVKDD